MGLHFLNADLSHFQYFPYPPSPKIKVKKYLLWPKNFDFSRKPICELGFKTRDSEKLSCTKYQRSSTVYLLKNFSILSVVNILHVDKK